VGRDVVAARTERLRFPRRQPVQDVSGVLADRDDVAQVIDALKVLCGRSGYVVFGRDVVRIQHVDWPGRHITSPATRCGGTPSPPPVPATAFALVRLLPRLRSSPGPWPSSPDRPQRRRWWSPATRDPARPGSC